MFPEDFPTVLAALTFWKRQVGTCVDASSYLWAQQLAVKSCHFSPGCVEPVSPARCPKLKLIRQGGAGEGLQGEPEMYHLFPLQRWGEARMNKERKKPSYKVFAVICGSKQWNHFLSVQWGWKETWGLSYAERQPGFLTARWRGFRPAFPGWLSHHVG